MDTFRDAGADLAEADVIDLTGQTSLTDAVDWLGRSQLYVGNDSGLMHVAAAMGTPTIGLFGSSSPEWTRPAGPRVAVIAAEGFPCRPCYRRTCNQPVFCLGTVDASRVLAAARDLLGRAEVVDGGARHDLEGTRPWRAKERPGAVP